MNNKVCNVDATKSNKKKKNKEISLRSSKTKNLHLYAIVNYITRFFFNIKHNCYFLRYFCGCIEHICKCYSP